MNNNYKQILLAILIAFCCAVIRLNADLLNGPYSPESQELVKLVRNPDQLIPENLKKYESQVKSLRKQFDPQSKMISLGTNPKWLEDKVFYEALVQLLFQLKPKPNFLYADYKPDEDYKAQIANSALIVKDFTTFKQILQNTSIELKNDLLGMTYLVMPLESSKEFQDDMERLKVILDNGANINAIDNKFKTTALDTLNNGLESGFYPSKEQTQQLIDFLKSKGAKTYAELTAAQKVQK